MEELETTNEELQSTNEELEMTNEELQSTNEELEMMNEELQSTNEELEAMNDEMRERTDEAVGANAFLTSILSSVHQSVIVVDESLRIGAWSRAAAEAWGLREDDVRGEHLFNLDIGIPTDRLRDPIREVLAGDEHEDVVLEGHDRRGRRVACTISFAQLTGAGGRVAGVILLMVLELLEQRAALGLAVAARGFGEPRCPLALDDGLLAVRLCALALPCGAPALLPGHGDGDRMWRRTVRQDLLGERVEVRPRGARGVAKEEERVLDGQVEPLGEHAFGLLDHDAGVERRLELLHSGAQFVEVRQFRKSSGRRLSTDCGIQMGFRATELRAGRAV